MRSPSSIWQHELVEFPLPYKLVRESSDPDATLMAFLGTHRAAISSGAHREGSINLVVSYRRQDSLVTAAKDTTLAVFNYDLPSLTGLYWD
jgi:hypothetical protein